MSARLFHSHCNTPTFVTSRKNRVSCKQANERMNKIRCQFSFLAHVHRLFNASCFSKSHTFSQDMSSEHISVAILIRNSHEHPMPTIVHAQSPCFARASTESHKAERKIPSSFADVSGMHRERERAQNKHENPVPIRFGMCKLCINYFSWNPRRPRTISANIYANASGSL